MAELIVVYQMSTDALLIRAWCLVGNSAGKVLDVLYGGVWSGRFPTVEATEAFCFKLFALASWYAKPL